MVKKFSKLLALSLVLLFLIVCLALGGCKKIGTQGESGETNGDTATTTAEQGVVTTTTSRVGDAVVLPGDEGEDDVVIEIEGTASSSTVDTSNLPSGTSSSKISSSKSSSSGTSSSKASSSKSSSSGTSSSKGTSSSQSSSSSQSQTNTTKSTKYSRAPGETPIFGPNT